MLPNKWYIVTTEESNLTILEWACKVRGNEIHTIDKTIGNFVTSTDGEIAGWMYHASHKKRGHTEISFQEFKKYVLGEEPEIKKVFTNKELTEQLIKLGLT